MPDILQTELAARIEQLFVEKGKPDHLDESFVKELFDGIPVQVDGQHVDPRSPKAHLVKIQAIFGGSVYPPALEKIVVFEEEKEFVTFNDRNQSRLRIDATAEITGYLEGSATYNIKLAGFEFFQNEVFGYIEVSNHRGTLRFVHREGLIEGGAGRGVWRPFRA